MVAGAKNLPCIDQHGATTDSRHLYWQELFVKSILDRRRSYIFYTSTTMLQEYYQERHEADLESKA
jgi:hypothetical protein